MHQEDFTLRPGIPFVEVEFPFPLYSIPFAIIIQQSHRIRYINFGLPQKLFLPHFYADDPQITTIIIAERLPVLPPNNLRNCLAPPELFCTTPTAIIQIATKPIKVQRDHCCSSSPTRSSNKNNWKPVQLISPLPIRPHLSLPFYLFIYFPSEQQTTTQNTPSSCHTAQLSHFVSPFHTISYFVVSLPTRHPPTISILWHIVQVFLELSLYRSRKTLQQSSRWKNKESHNAWR